MSDPRQLPLFSAQPASVEELHHGTRLVDALPLFQEHLRRQGKTQHTIDAFTSDLNLVSERFGDSMALGWFTTSRLNDFLAWMERDRGVPCSRKTYARRVTTLKVFFKWLRDSDVIPHDPALALLQRSGPAPLSDILTPEQVDSVLAAARAIWHGEKADPRPELLFRLIIGTGMKKSEAMRLRPDDIQWDAVGSLQVMVRHAEVKDLYRDRVLPLDPAVLAALDAYLAHYRPQTALFTCTARNLEYILEDLGRRAGVPQKISFEMLRWTFAVRSLLAGDDANTIRERLGLSEISWVETYAKVKLLAGVKTTSADGGQ